MQVIYLIHRQLAPAALIRPNPQLALAPVRAGRAGRDKTKPGKLNRTPMHGDPPHGCQDGDRQTRRGLKRTLEESEDDYDEGARRIVLP